MEGSVGTGVSPSTMSSNRTTCHARTRPLARSIRCLTSIEVGVMQTSGHTVGSCCFLIGDALFVGDTLFPEGVGFTHSEGGSASDLYDSVRRLDHEISDDTRVYSGHRYRRQPGLTFAELRRRNVYFHLSSRKDFVEFVNRRTVATSHDRLLANTPTTLPDGQLTWG